MQINKLECDGCSADFTDDELGKQEFLHMDRIGGYAAPFGDGLRVTLDLCPECQVKFLGDLVQIHED